MSALEEHQMRKAQSMIDLHHSEGHHQRGQVLREGRRTMEEVSAVSKCPERSYSMDRVASPYGTTHASRDVWHTESYRPRPYRRDWDTIDAYWHDRHFFHAPLTNATHRFAGRRYNMVDPPVGLCWYYPGSYYTPSRRYGILDPSDPVYAYRYRLPEYDPLPSRPVEPWRYNPGDVGRGLQLYKKGLCSFEALERNWLAPAAWDRRISQYKDVYVPADLYGARRYAYPVA